MKPHKNTPKRIHNKGANRRTRHVCTSLMLKVYAKYGRACAICGDSKQDIHIDHIIPWSKGGETVVENLRPLCKRCNQKRGNRDA